MATFAPNWAAIAQILGSSLAAPNGQYAAGAAQGAQNYQGMQNARLDQQFREQQMQMQQEAAERERTAAQDAQKRDQQFYDLLNPQSQARQVGNYGASVGGNMQTASGTPAPFADLSPEQRAFLLSAGRETGMDILGQRLFSEPKDTSTDDQREYRQAVDQGFQGSFLDYQLALKKAGAGNNSTTIYNKDYGSIPPGHRLVEGPEGVRLEALPVEALPGSPAAAEANAAAATQAQQKANQLQSADIVTQDISRAIQKIEGSPTATTGFIGNMMKGIGGTEASNVRSLLDTVEANTAFDRLQEMRNASKTGGALGSITERELALLAATKGNLMQSQDSDQLVFNLKRLNDVILDIVHGPGQGPQRYGSGGQGGGNDPYSKYQLDRPQ